MPEFARIYNFACWITQDRPAAENLVQETYTKALNGLASYHRGANFRAWIYRILRHTFLTTQAGMRASSNVTQGDAAYETNGSTPGPVLMAHIDEERLRECLEELPLNLREVLLLCDLEEMTYREISGTLGIPVGSVLGRLNRARILLRALLAAPRPVPAAAAPPPPVDDVPDMPAEFATEEYDQEMIEPEDEGEVPDEPR